MTTELPTGSTQLTPRADAVRAGHAWCRAAAADVSAKPGDRRSCCADGTIEGFVGGTCAEATVRAHGARALATGEPLLLRIAARRRRRRARERRARVTVANPCLSGGALEIFLEPRCRRRAWSSSATRPIAEALGRRSAGRSASTSSRRRAQAQPPAGDAAVVVASHGRDEEPALDRGAAAPACRYVGLVASRNRGAGRARRARRAPTTQRGRVHTPGRARHRRPGPPRRSRCRSWPRSSPSDRGRRAVARRRGRRRRRPRAAIDPVCGMTVAVASTARRTCDRRRRRRLVLRHRLPRRLRRRPGPVPALTAVEPRRRGRTSPTGCPTSRAARRARRRRLPRRPGPGDRAVPRRPAAASRCCWRASRASARPRRPRRWPRVLDTPLIRLQCYEGIDAAEALYEWNYPRQLLGIRLAEARGDAAAPRPTCSAAEYLLERPLLQAIEHPGPRPAVLLHRRDRPGRRRVRGVPVRAAGRGGGDRPGARHASRPTHPPVVVLTSNRTRDLHDALTRRCLYHWIDYPRPGAGGRDRPPAGARQRRAAGAWPRPRRSPGCARWTWQKPPGIAEAIDWVAALSLLGPDPARRRRASRPRWGSVLKYREDQELARARGAAWLAGA